MPYPVCLRAVYWPQTVIVCVGQRWQGLQCPAFSLPHCCCQSSQGAEPLQRDTHSHNVEEIFKKCLKNSSKVIHIYIIQCLYLMWLCIILNIVHNCLFLNVFFFLMRKILCTFKKVIVHVWTKIDREGKELRENARGTQLFLNPSMSSLLLQSSHKHWRHSHSLIVWDIK